MAIHPTAIVDKRAEIDSSAEVGAYCVIKGKVKIGSGTRLENNVTIGFDSGEVTIGKDNLIFPGAMVGGAPQDMSYKNQIVKLEIGDRNIIREFCTLNLGTVKGGGVTKIGSECMIMAYVHVAHDCSVGNKVILANACQIAGHSHILDRANVGGGTLISQFCTLGRFAYIGGGSVINKDILPFTIAQGSYAVSRATNKIGLERGGVSEAEVENINRAVRLLIMGNRTIEEALQKIETECTNSEYINEMVAFVKKSERGIAR